jgi:hypothetical protein
MADSLQPEQLSRENFEKWIRATYRAWEERDALTTRLALAQAVVEAAQRWDDADEAFAHGGPPPVFTGALDGLKVALSALRESETE